MTNHDMFAMALKPYQGRKLKTKEIGVIVCDAFPEFSEGSIRPNDHGEGNKSPCWCARSGERLLDREERGVYLVR